MKLTHVLRSYVGNELSFGPVTVKPWGSTEVEHEQLEAAVASAGVEFSRAVQARELSMCMISDGQPVHPMNEAAILKAYKTQ